MDAWGQSAGAKGKVCCNNNKDYYKFVVIEPLITVMKIRKQDVINALVHVTMG